MSFNIPLTIALLTTSLNTNSFATKDTINAPNFYIQSESYYKEDDNILMQIDPNLGQSVNKTYTEPDKTDTINIFYIEATDGKIVDMNNEYIIISHSGLPSNTTIELDRIDSPLENLYIGKNITMYTTRNIYTGVIDNIKLI